MSELHVKEFTDAFEAVAFDAADDANLPLAVMAQLSVAISMKRIADVLQGANMDAFQNQLLDIAYRAGLNFRGQA